MLLRQLSLRWSSLHSLWCGPIPIASTRDSNRKQGLVYGSLFGTVSTTVSYRVTNYVLYNIYSYPVSPQKPISHSKSWLLRSSSSTSSDASQGPVSRPLRPQSPHAMVGRRILAKHSAWKGLLRTLRPSPSVLETTMFRPRISSRRAETLFRAVLGILATRRTLEGRTTIWYAWRMCVSPRQPCLARQTILLVKVPVSVAVLVPQYLNGSRAMVGRIDC